ncbi:hypothetical protein WH292_22495, partial [Enterobacter sp. MYb186]
MAVSCGITGWRWAYPACGSVLLCRVALRLPGLRFGAAVPGGASLTRPTVRCCCAGWRFAYPAYGSVLLCRVAL